MRYCSMQHRHSSSRLSLMHSAHSQSHTQTSKAAIATRLQYFVKHVEGNDDILLGEQALMRKHRQMYQNQVAMR